MCCIVFVTSGCWFLSKLQSTKGLATKIHTHNIPTFYQDNFQILALCIYEYRMPHLTKHSIYISSYSKYV